MTHRYERVDEIYKEFPELKELVKAAQRVAQLSIMDTDALIEAIANMRVAGAKWDNRT